MFRRKTKKRPKWLANKNVWYDIVSFAPFFETLNNNNAQRTGAASDVNNTVTFGGGDVLRANDRQLTEMNSARN
jgi:hypothetical protein